MSTPLVVPALTLSGEPTTVDAQTVAPTAFNDTARLPPAPPLLDEALRPLYEVRPAR